MNLKGKVVVITGASSGIGEACAYEFAKKSANLVLAARRVERLKEVAKRILALNSRCLIVQTDVTRELDMKKLIENADKKFGRIDILVNNAGKGLKSRLEGITRKDWDTLIATNVTSVLFGTKEAVLRMRKKKIRGHIITISSMAGKFGVPHFSAYCASKHAVTGLMKTLRWELRKDRIKVSTVHPGRVHTEFFKEYDKHPFGWEMLESIDIAQYVVALAERNPLKAGFFKLRNTLKRLTNLLRITA